MTQTANFMLTQNPTHNHQIIQCEQDIFRGNRHFNLVKTNGINLNTVESNGYDHVRL